MQQPSQNPPNSITWKEAPGEDLAKFLRPLSAKREYRYGPAYIATAYTEIRGVCGSTCKIGAPFSARIALSLSQAASNQELCRCWGPRKTSMVIVKQPNNHIDHVGIFSWEMWLKYVEMSQGTATRFVPGLATNLRRRRWTTRAKIAPAWCNSHWLSPPWLVCCLDVDPLPTHCCRMCQDAGKKRELDAVGVHFFIVFSKL